MRWLTVTLLAVLTAAGIAATPDAAAQTDDGDATRGEEIYQATCAMCHGADATGMMGMHPALTGVVDRLTRQGVVITIRNGRDTRPPMPAFDDRLDDTDIADLIAYLDELPDGPRNFGPEAAQSDGQMMDGEGMGEMMERMMGGGATTALWLVVVVLAAALAGVVGYLVGRDRSRS